MNKYLPWIIFCLLIVQGCTNGSRRDHFLMTMPKETFKTSQRYEKNHMGKEIQAPMFEHIKLVGNFDLRLTEDSYKSSVSIFGPKDQLGNIDIEVNGRSIEIKNLNKRVTSTIEVIVNTAELEYIQFNGNGVVRNELLSNKSFDFDIETDGKVLINDQINVRYLQAGGTGKINFKKINSGYLSLTKLGSSSVELEGKVKLNFLEMRGGRLKVYWVESPLLRIIGKGSPFAEIAGVVDTLEIDLKDRARFNGKYLRVQKVYAKTYDYAHADIYAKEVRAAESFGKSNIYTHRNADLNSNYMANQGVVLDVSEIES